jgi:hypothetical protein
MGPGTGVVDIRIALGTLALSLLACRADATESDIIQPPGHDFPAIFR